MKASQLLWVFSAGGIGSCARYLVSSACLAVFGPLFPVGTLAVNLLGCFLLAVLAELAVSTELVSPTLRVTLAVGFLGGLTTYSTFSHETFIYLRDGAFALGVAYLTATLVGCLAACLLGQATARWFVGG